MVVKSYTADSVAEALKLMRSELGRDAVIVSSRQVPRGKGLAVEITARAGGSSAPAEAGHSEESTRTSPVTIPQPDPEQRSEPTPACDHELPLALNLLYDRLEDADFPQQSIDDIMSRVVATCRRGETVPAVARETLSRFLSRWVGDKPVFSAGDRVLVHGPAGCGKTTVLAKLATELRGEHRVQLTGLDFTKISAYDELYGYADLLGIEFVRDIVDRNVALESADAILLIDGPSTVLTSEQRSALAHLQPTHRIVVVSALTRSADVAAFCSRLEELRSSLIAVTMTDLTHRLGSAVTAAQKMAVPIALISNSPSGASMLARASGPALAASILSREHCRV